MRMPVNSSWTIGVVNNLVLRHQIAAECDRIDAVDLEIGDRARLFRVERSVKSYFWHVLEPVHPISRKVSQPFLFSLAADRVVKQDRVGFVPGVTPDKWARIWAERMPRRPLELVPLGDRDGVALVRSGELAMCFVRLPVDRDGLHLIPLYDELPVVVVAKEHPVAAFDEIDVADLADEQLLQDPDTVPEWRDVATEVRPTAAATRCRRCRCARPWRAWPPTPGSSSVPMSLARLHHRKDVVARAGHRRADHDGRARLAGRQRRRPGADLHRHRAGPDGEQLAPLPLPPQRMARAESLADASPAGRQRASLVRSRRRDWTPDHRALVQLARASRAPA